MDISKLKISAQPALDLESPFRCKNGWIGADGNYSVPLGDGRIAWLFSDTFVGKVEDGKRVDTVMINNSIGIQQVDSQDLVDFYFGATGDGKPAAFVTPDDDDGYFWIFDGIQTTKGLFFFLPRIRHLEVTSGFPFKGIGMSLAHIANPDATPDKWQVTQAKVPFSHYGDDGTIAFGSATMRLGDYVYIYGFDSVPREGSEKTNRMIVARVREDEFGDFSAWRVLCGGEWGRDWEHADALFPGVATEFSVSYVPGIQHYAAVYSAGLSGVIELRLSPAPEGPWGDPITVFDVPDKNWHEKAFSYAGKAHPELATTPNEMVLTYACNSMNFDDLFNDARLYWPRFVRVTFDEDNG